MGAQPGCPFLSRGVVVAELESKAKKRGPAPPFRFQGSRDPLDCPCDSHSGRRRDRTQSDPVTVPSVPQAEEWYNRSHTVWGRVGSTGDVSAGLQAEAPSHLVKRWQNNSWQQQRASPGRLGGHVHRLLSSKETAGRRKSRCGPTDADRWRAKDSSAGPRRALLVGTAGSEKPNTS